MSPTCRSVSRRALSRVIARKLRVIGDIGTFLGPPQRGSIEAKGKRPVEVLQVIDHVVKRSFDELDLGRGLQGPDQAKLLLLRR